MAKVYIAEWGDFRFGLPYRAPLAVQNVTSSGSSQAVTASAQTRFVRVHTDGIVSININAAATTNSLRMAANESKDFIVDPGDTINIITNT